jgi:hypothetical protein
MTTARWVVARGRWRCRHRITLLARSVRCSRSNLSNRRFRAEARDAVDRLCSGAAIGGGLATFVEVAAGHFRRRSALAVGAEPAAVNCRSGTIDDRGVQVRDVTPCRDSGRRSHRENGLPSKPITFTRYHLDRKPTVRQRPLRIVQGSVSIFHAIAEVDEATFESSFAQ